MTHVANSEALASPLNDSEAMTSGQVSESRVNDCEVMASPQVSESHVNDHHHRKVNLL